MDRVLAYSKFREQYKGYIRTLYDPAEDIVHIGDAISRLVQRAQIIPDKREAPYVCRPAFAGSQPPCGLCSA